MGRGGGPARAGIYPCPHKVVKSFAMQSQIGIPPMRPPRRTGGKDPVTRQAAFFSSAGAASSASGFLSPRSTRISSATRVPLSAPPSI